MHQNAPQSFPRTPTETCVAGGLARLDELSLPHLGEAAHLALSEADADAATGGRKAHDH